MSIYHPEQKNYLSESRQPYIGENMHMTMAQFLPFMKFLPRNALK